MLRLLFDVLDWTADNELHENNILTELMEYVIVVLFVITKAQTVLPWLSLS